jgi:hypothetical protein
MRQPWKNCWSKAARYAGKRVTGCRQKAINKTSFVLNPPNGLQGNYEV